MAVDVCQTHVSSAESVSQLRVVDTEQMEHRCVQVVNLDSILNDLVPEFWADPKSQSTAISTASCTDSGFMTEWNSAVMQSAKD